MGRGGLLMASKEEAEFGKWKGIIERQPDYYKTIQDLEVANVPKDLWGKLAEVCPPVKEALENTIEKKANLLWDSELKDYDMPEIEWLIDGLIPCGGVGVWTGKRGSLKTWLGLHAVYSIATGEKFLGKFETKKGPVYYLDKENGIPIMKLRSRMIKEGLKVKEADVLFSCFTQIKIDNLEGLEVLEEVIKENKPSLLVIDTYRRAIGFDENDAGMVSTLFVDGLRPLVEKYYPLSIVLIHHDKKGGFNSRDEMDEVRGSSDLVNYCDFILKNQRKGKDLILKQLKNRNAPEHEPIPVAHRTDEETYMEFAVGETKLLSQDERCAEDLIVWIHQENLKKFKTDQAKEVAFEKGYRKQAFYDALKILKERGVVESVVKGFYNVIQNKGGGDSP